MLYNIVILKPFTFFHVPCDYVTMPSVTVVTVMCDIILLIPTLSCYELIP